MNKRASWVHQVKDGRLKIGYPTQDLKSRNVEILEKLCDLRDENYFRHKINKKRNPDLPQIEYEFEKHLCCHCNDILVVDDEPMGVKAIKHLLVKQGLNSDICNDGEEGVSKVKLCFSKSCCTKRYQLIFMDLMMPVMKGDEASKQIEKIYESHNEKVSIVVVSAHENEEVATILSQIKCIKHFVPKPPNKRAIEEILQKYYYK